MILSKVVLVVIFLLATAQVSAPIDADLESVSQPMAGVVLMLMAGFAPYLSYKAIAFMGFDMYHAMSAEQEAKGSLNRPMPIPLSRRTGSEPAKILGDGGGGTTSGGSPAAAPSGGGSDARCRWRRQCGWSVRWRCGSSGRRRRGGSCRGQGGRRRRAAARRVRGCASERDRPKLTSRPRLRLSRPRSPSPRSPSLPDGSEPS